ncbi:MAG: nuclear transport factor 2 family protein [Rikenellaceae bacterium]
MKKTILSAAALLSVAAVFAQQGIVNDYDFGDFKVHTYTSAEAMHDVSILVEGEKSLVVLEPQSFYKSIEDFNAYAEKLGKPIEKIVANYHAGGLAECDLKKVVMVEPMAEFMKGEMAQGMMTKFAGAFQGAMDTRSVKIKKTIPAVGTQTWAGVEFDFVNGAASDFPASSVNIGGKVYYTHFAPDRGHLAPMRIKNSDSIDAILADLTGAKESGCEVFIGSHGSVATMEDVEFMVSYLNTIKNLMAECSSSDLFAQRLIVAYPTLAVAENVKAIAKALYPNEVVDSRKEAVKARVQDYFDMVSNLDADIAKNLWATTGDISIITPRAQFFGAESIMNDFLIKTFSSMQSRKLHSLSEVVNIYGTSANVQLYWIFDTVDAAGEKHQTRGRESLVFEEIAEEWKLVHVHYSRMPQ